MFRCHDKTGEPVAYVDPRRQDLVRRIAAAHPETKWGPKELQELHDELEAWGE